MKKKEKIFVIISIIFLLGSIILYGSRFTYYYLKSKNKTKNTTDLYELVKNSEIKYGDGLYNNGNEYVYKGVNVNNYVIYSNILWRIIKIEDNKISLVMDKPITNIYYKDIDNFINNFKIDKSLLNEIKILSREFYEAPGKNNFINNGYYTYLDDNHYLNDKGNINELTLDHLYGLKLMININSKNIISGTGKKDSPYLLDIGVKNIKDANIGSYIIYNNTLWRIKDNNEYITLISDEIVHNINLNNDFNTIYNYLNNEYEIDKTYLIENNYDNNDGITPSTINTLVAIPNLNDLFINDVDNYILINKTLGDTIYEIKNNGITYENRIDNTYGIRPVITIKNNLELQGNGTINNPYIIVGEI